MSYCVAKLLFSFYIFFKSTTFIQKSIQNQFESLMNAIQCNESKEADTEEEEAADEELGEQLGVAPRLEKGGHGHEAGLARHLQELVVPEVGLVLAADEADPRLAHVS